MAGAWTEILLRQSGTSMANMLAASGLPIINLYMGNFAAEPHDFAVYTYYVSGFPVGDPNQLPPAARVSAPGKDGHGGEERVAALMAYYPELIHLERSHDEAFEPGHGAEDRTNPPPAGAMREIPTGYSGDAAGATAARGHALVDFQVARVVKFIGAVKADKATLAEVDAGIRAAVEKAKSTDTDKVIAAMAGQTFKAPSGIVSKMDEKNHHLHKSVFIGEIKADGQFNVVWKTPGPVKAQPWSPFIPENKGKKDEPVVMAKK